MRKIRPADEVEVAAHRILTGEPVLPETIVNGPEQRFQDERTIDPLTAPATPRPAAAVPSTPAPSAAIPATPQVVSPDTQMSAPRTPRQVQARDKTGEPARSRSPPPSREDAFVAIKGSGPPDGSQKSVDVAFVGDHKTRSV